MRFVFFRLKVYYVKSNFLLSHRGLKDLSSKYLLKLLALQHTKQCRSITDLQ